ncbi:hypothetical protein WJX84_001226 [Apatococcus fuscideae]|uniref:Uncharacterized protein n=1 Tax=Apatococcus fuscideae TaxID=2026836 RepID=A0AAW1TAJ9_9CHLO
MARVFARDSWHLRAPAPTACSLAPVGDRQFTELCCCRHCGVYSESSPEIGVSACSRWSLADLFYCPDILVSCLLLFAESCTRAQQNSLLGQA